MRALAWLHDLNPFIWKFSPDFGLRWYGLSYALGFLAAWGLMRFLSARGVSPIPRARAGDAVMLAALCIVAGGRLGYVLVYEPSLLTRFSGGIPFWGVLMIHKGGMASHGGMVGAIVGAMLVSRGFKDERGQRVGRAPLWRVIDTFALITPIGLALGRLANFVNGELLGKIVARAGEPAPWWSVRFPQEVLERPGELSIEQVEGLSRAMGLAGVPRSDAEQAIFDAAYRGLLERLQNGSRDAHTLLEPLINARHPSQLYQMVGEGLLVGVVVWLVARRPRKAGVISGTFAVVYGVQRVVTEFWRLPDAHLASPTIMGLSRGQWLSVLLALAGVGIILWAARRGREVTPGWALPASDRA